MEISSEEFENVLHEAGLEEAGKGVFFPWGVKIVDIDGKKNLQPMTPEEYKLAVKEDTGRVLSEGETINPSCGIASNRCVSQGCRRELGKCEMHANSSGRFYCLCDY